MNQMDQLNKKGAIEQISEAIKYFKSKFPSTYKQFKYLHQGQKSFQKHLTSIQYMFTQSKFSHLFNRVLDELIIKLQFISVNHDYLQNFEIYLLEKFISFCCVDSIKRIYDFNKIYFSTNVIQLEKHKKQRLQLYQKYSVILEALLVILKFIFINKFNNQSLQQRKEERSYKFENQMIKGQSSKKVQITFKSFTKFILRILQQKIDEILQFSILNEQKIFPQLYSVLSQGLLHYKEGSKCLQLIVSILLRIIDKNKDSIWLIYNNEHNQSKSQKIEKIKSNILKLLKNQNNNQSQIMTQTTNQNRRQQKQNNAFNQICRQRILLTLQSLKSQYGLSKNKQVSVSQLNDSTQLVQNSKRNQKLYYLVLKLLMIIQNKLFSQTQQNGINQLQYISQLNQNIIQSLVFLYVQLNNSEIIQVQQQLKQPQIILMLKRTSFRRNSIYPQTQLLSKIRNNLKTQFISIFQQLIQKNKTISSKKTHLLSQLKNITPYVNLQQTTSYEQFQQGFCQKLKNLFTISQLNLNKPLVVVNDTNKILLSSTQSIPLTDLKPTDTIYTYPVSMQALKQSIKFQQQKYILDEIRLFDWFQGEQLNLRYFKQMITNFDIKTKIHLLQFFINQLLKSKMQQTQHIYSLDMSLIKFYQLIINFFFIDCLLNQSKDMFISNKDQDQNTSQLLEKALLPKLYNIYNLLLTNRDLNRLLITSKQEQLFICWNIKTLCTLNNFLLLVEKRNASVKNKRQNLMKITYLKILIAQNLILNVSQSTYLLKLLTTFNILQFSQTKSVSQTLKPLQSTLIHRNGGNSVNGTKCNLEFIKNLIKICILKPKQAEQLASIYLSKDYISNISANQVISLLFPKLCTQTMRKCILSVAHWYTIFLKPSNIQLLNNKQMKQSQKQDIFHSNDGQNVTVSNALGVIVLQLGQKWTAQLQFRNPKRQILIDVMLNLIGVNDKLVFWKRFFFQTILRKIIQILTEISKFNNLTEPKKQSSQTYSINTFSSSNNNFEHNKSKTLQKSNRQNLYQRIKRKIFLLFQKIPVQYYKYCTQINSQIRNNLDELKGLVQNENNWLKKQCFLNQKYDQYIDPYKQTNAVLQKIDAGLSYIEELQ